MIEKELSLGRLILRARRRKGLTQAGLSKKLEISASYMCHIENDTYGISPSEELCDKLAEVLSVTPSVVKYLSGRAALNAGKYAVCMCESNFEFIEIFSRMYLDPKFRYQILKYAQESILQPEQDETP